MPFAAAALFLGVAFQHAQSAFGRLYFADLVGSGCCVLFLLVGMYALDPADLIVVPVLLGAAASVAWFHALQSWRGIVIALSVSAFTLVAHVALPLVLGIQPLVISDFKSVSYARNLPDAARVYDHTSPFGRVEVYMSSYLHFAPGLSDNAAFNLPKLPASMYAGLYLDSEGPFGIVRKLNAEEARYFRFLPMIYPYLLARGPNTLIVQWGGGLSTSLALHSGAGNVMVAEPNPAIRRVFTEDATIKAFTGDVLGDGRVKFIQDEARLHLVRSVAATTSSISA